MKNTLFFDHNVSDQNKTILKTYFDIRNNLFQTKLFDLHHRYTDYKDNISIKSYWNEIGQINLDFGRQTGSSFWQAYFLDQCEKKKLTTRSIFYNHKMQKRFVEIFKEHFRDKSHRIVRDMIGENQQLTISNSDGTVHCDEFRGSVVDFVIVDVSALYTTKQISSVIDAARYSLREMLILI